jgi:hypothetical protein
MERRNARVMLYTLMLTVGFVSLTQAQRRQPISIGSEETSKNLSALKLGEASGTIKGVGGTVRVRYAYARWVKDARNANEKMIELVLTEKAIPKAKLAFVFAGNLSYYPLYQELDEKPRGIRFYLKKDGSMYQKELLHVATAESGMLELKEFKLAGDQLSGADEERNSGIDGERWGYSISFVVSVSK